jgi:hypothetical protein
MLRFTIRDLLWLTAVVGLGLAVWLPLTPWSGSPAGAVLITALLCGYVTASRITHFDFAFSVLSAALSSFTALLMALILLRGDWGVFLGYTRDRQFAGLAFITFGMGGAVCGSILGLVFGRLFRRGPRK